MPTEPINMGDTSDASAGELVETAAEALRDGLVNKNRDFWGRGGRR